MGNQPTYQGLYNRMQQLGSLREDCSGAEALERLKALEDLMCDMLEVALSEKKS